MTDKECCLHPGQPNFRCPECKKEKAERNLSFSREKDNLEMEKLRKKKSMCGVPQEICRHADEDMPYGE